MANNTCGSKLATIIPYPTSVSGIIIYLNNQKTLLDLAACNLHESPEDDLMADIPRPLNLKTPKIWRLRLKNLEIDQPADKTK